jgi:Kef-type K+ transport system membrane component KefB
METFAPVPPLGGHELLIFLVQVGLLLAIALLLGRLAALLGMPAVAGELCAGILLGPSLLGHFAPGFADWLLPRESTQVHLLDAVGQIGVLLLVGIIGSQLDLSYIRRQRRTAAQVGAASLVVPLLLGFGVGYLVPISLVGDGTSRAVFAFFLGVALCVSAVPVIAKTLLDMGLLHRNVGQLILAASLIDDTAGWVLLSMVSALVTAGLSTASAISLGSIVGVVLAAGFLRPVVRLILWCAGRGGNDGGPITAVTVLLLLAAAGTHALGLEPVFGAFVCGAVIGTTGGVEPAGLVPLRTIVLGVLAPIFFATAGLRIDLTALGGFPVLAAALLILFAAVLGKFAGAYIGARLSHLTHWEGIALGAGLNSRGVIQIVVATVGLRIGVLTTASYTVVVLVAIATSLMAPPALRMATRRFGPSVEESRRAERLALPPGAAGRRGTAATDSRSG